VGFALRVSVISLSAVSSLSLKVASVASILPSGVPEGAPFGGALAGRKFPDPGPALSPAEEAARRAQEVETQKQDAEARRIIWAADDELTDRDAEGEDDPDYNALTPKTSQQQDTPSLLGIRQRDGTIIPLPAQRRNHSDAGGNGMAVKGEDGVLSSSEAQFMGVLETVPCDLNELVSISHYDYTSSTR
jgi:meiosis-specific protein